MSATSQSESKTESAKTAAIIYLSSHRPLHLPDFFSEFRDNWPSVSLEKVGREPHRAFFRAGRSEFSLEYHHAAVPEAMTEPVANSTLHWPNAAAALAKHVSYFELIGSQSSHGPLTLASDLTRAITSLLAVTDPIAVCWLKGPALNQAKTFISTARETLATGLYPLSLWTAVRWEADSHSLATYGMRQFDAPELLLRQQPDAAPLMVDYLFRTALSLLVSRHPIREGETVEGPHGRIKVKPGTMNGKKGVLILDPAS